jgi:mannose-6-phosphate isomerase-like protein (cupin superfamily)
MGGGEEDRTIVLTEQPSYVSPGGAAEIRIMLSRDVGELTHALCPAGKVSTASVLEGLYERYYVLAGRGLLWRRSHDYEGVTALTPGRWCDIPPGTVFQYRAEPDIDLVFLVMVTPRWKRERYVNADNWAWPSDDGANAGTLDGEAASWLQGVLPAVADYLAPDGSEIRLLGGHAAGGLAHCRLGPGQTSIAVRHHSVTELWFITGGHGRLWRQHGGDGDEVPLRYGTSVSIDMGERFQFRSTGIEPLEFVIATMPAWPGPTEAERVDGRWSVPME